MSLSESTLKDNILEAYNKALNDQLGIANPPSPAPPGMSSQMAGALAKAYDDYAKKAEAGALNTIVTPGLKSALESSLTGAEEYSGWGSGVAAYWAPVMFTGGGYIPSNPIIPLPTLSTGIDGEIKDYVKVTRDSVEKSAADLAKILHSWTTKQMVTTTTTSTPPVVSTATVS